MRSEILCFTGRLPAERIAAIGIELLVMMNELEGQNSFHIQAAERQN
jgi:hypothetical protein